MIELEQMLELIGLSAELDRYATADKLTIERAVAWSAVVRAKAPGMTFEQAQLAIIEFYGEAGESLTPLALIETWRRMHRLAPAQVAADVRSARSRGLIGAEWSESEPLPPSVAERLRNARESDREQNALEHGGNAVTNAITEH